MKVKIVQYVPGGSERIRYNDVVRVTKTMIITINEWGNQERFRKSNGSLLLGIKGVWNLPEIAKESLGEIKNA